MELVGIDTGHDCSGSSLVPRMTQETPPASSPAFQETGIWLSRIPGMDEHHLRYPELTEILNIEDYSTGTLSIKQEYLETIITAKDRMVRLDHWKLVYIPLADGPSSVITKQVRNGGAVRMAVLDRVVNAMAARQ